MTRQRTRIIALIAGCAVAAGGAFAVTDALSSPTPAAAVSTVNSPAQPAGTGSDAAGESAQAAALSSVITTEAGNTPGATLAQRLVRLRRARRALVRLRLLGGEHGQVTYKTKNGSRTLAFERGTIESVAGNDVTVRAADGTTWIWQLTNTSVVREDGSRAASSALAAGQPVFTGGPVTGTTRDARLIVIRKLTRR
jgi:hypothetical protein